jgi:hypothetical protein
MLLAGEQRVYTLAASAARTDAAGATITAIEIPDRAERAGVLLDITASATEAGDTLDVYIDVSPDNGTTYLNAGHFAQQAGNGSAAKQFLVLDRSNPGTSSIAVTSDAAAGVVRPAVWGTHMRLRYTIVEVTGDNASHTFGSTVFFS